VQEAQMAQQVPTAQYGPPDLGLQQQLAAQGRMPGGNAHVLCDTLKCVEFLALWKFAINQERSNHCACTNADDIH